MHKGLENIGVKKRNAIEISHDRFAYDVRRLVHAIGGAYGTMIVCLGTTYLTMMKSRILCPTEVFEVYLDKKRVGKIEVPGFSHNFEMKKSKKVSWLPVAIRVREGVHNVFIGIRSYKSSHTINRSNELSFKIRGGQSISFAIDREISSIGISQLVLKTYKPIIEP